MYLIHFLLLRLDYIIILVINARSSLLKFLQTMVMSLSAAGISELKEKYIICALVLSYADAPRLPVSI